MGAIKVSRVTFSLLLAATPSEKIAEVGREAGKDAPIAIITAKDGKLSLQSIIGFLKMMSQYAKLYEFNETLSSDGRSKILTLMHNFGRNGSEFLINYVSVIFERIDIEPKVSSSEHSVILEVLLPALADPRVCL